MKIPWLAHNFPIINKHLACYVSYIKFTPEMGCWKNVLIEITPNKCEVLGTMTFFL